MGSATANTSNAGPSQTAVTNYELRGLRRDPEVEPLLQVRGRPKQEPVIRLPGRRPRGSAAGRPNSESRSDWRRLRASAEGVAVVVATALRRYGSGIGSRSSLLRFSAARADWGRRALSRTLREQESGPAPPYHRSGRGSKVTRIRVIRPAST
jgi:hypothetical protein